MSFDLPGMGGDFAKTGASGAGNVYDTSPTGLGISPAYLSQGASASASSTAGTALQTYATRTTSVSTTGTTFGTGADLLASALSFTADGTSDYLIRVGCCEWTNSAGANTQYLSLNLDSAEAGLVAVQSGFTVYVPLTAVGVILAPSAGAHTVNLRLWVNGGTGTINAGTSGTGAAAYRPILVTVEKLG